MFDVLTTYNEVQSDHQFYMANPFWNQYVPEPMVILEGDWRKKGSMDNPDVVGMRATIDFAFLDKKLQEEANLALHLFEQTLIGLVNKQRGVVDLNQKDQHDAK